MKDWSNNLFPSDSVSNGLSINNLTDQFPNITPNLTNWMLSSYGAIDPAAQYGSPGLESSYIATDPTAERMVNGYGFTVPMVNSENIGQFILPPTTLHDSQNFLSNNFAQQQLPTTGNNDDIFWDTSNEITTNLPRTLYTMNQVSPLYSTNRVSFHPEDVLPQQCLINPTYNNPNQFLDFLQTDNLGVNMWNQNSNRTVGANLEEHIAINEPRVSNNDQICTGDPNVFGSLTEDGYNWRNYWQPQVRGSAQSSYHGSSSWVPNNMLLENGSQDGTDTDTSTGGNIVWKHDNHGLDYGNQDLSLHQQNVSQLNSSSTLDGSSQLLCGDNRSHVTQGCVQLDCGGEGYKSESNKSQNEISTPNTSVPNKPAKGDRVIVHTISNVDKIDDGYRWRKYGEKIVIENPNPRNYYRCTTAGCPVKKQIEKSPNDVNVVVTTYEGRHNHAIPTP